jgi:hypothetical protein
VESCDLTAQNNAFLFIDFYIVETLYKPVTIAKNFSMKEIADKVAPTISNQHSSMLIQTFV